MDPIYVTGHRNPDTDSIVSAMAYAALCNAKIQFLLSRIEMLTMQSCRGKVLAFLLAEKARAYLGRDAAGARPLRL